MRCWSYKPIERWPGELLDNDDRPYHRFEAVALNGSPAATAARTAGR